MQIDLMNFFYFFIIFFMHACLNEMQF